LYDFGAIWYLHHESSATAYLKYETGVIFIQPTSRYNVI
jgi:hypothetical protein